MRSLIHAKLQYENRRRTPQTLKNRLRSRRQGNERNSPQSDRGVCGEGRKKTEAKKLTRMERDRKRHHPQPIPNPAFLIRGKHGY